MSATDQKKVLFFLISSRAPVSGIWRMFRLVRYFTCRQYSGRFAGNSGSSTGHCRSSETQPAVAGQPLHRFRKVCVINCEARCVLSGGTHQTLCNPGKVRWSFRIVVSQISLGRSGTFSPWFASLTAVVVNRLKRQS